eukprot:1286580-Amphidinium_carterae.1
MEPRKDSNSATIKVCCCSALGDGNYLHVQLLPRHGSIAMARRRAVGRKSRDQSESKLAPTRSRSKLLWHALPHSNDTKTG